MTDTPEAVALKPCPFCGDLPEDGMDDDQFGFGVWCMTDTCPVEPRAGPYETQAQAIDAWNHRASRPDADIVRQLVGAIEVARETLCDYACHAGKEAPCIRTKQQCAADCGKRAGDAIIYLDGILTAAGYGGDHG